MSKKDPEVVVATTSFTVGDRTVAKGETFREGHPIVEGREELFEPFTVDNEIEQATAAPGEKRGRGRGKKAESTTGSSAGPADYSGLNMKALKADLDKRGVEYSAPPGTSKADLVALLEADDKKQQG